GEWWPELIQQALKWSPGAQSLCSLSILAGMTDSIENRKQMFDTAFKAFSPPGRGEAAPALNLDRDPFGRILFIQFAAWNATIDGKAADEPQLLDALLEHERQYWGFPEHALASERAMRIAVTLITLIQGCAASRGVLEEFLGSAPYITDLTRSQ